MKRITIKSVLSSVTDVCSRYGFVFDVLNRYTHDGKYSYVVFLLDIFRETHLVAVPEYDGLNLTASFADDFGIAFENELVNSGCVCTSNLSLYAEAPMRISNALCLTSVRCKVISSSLFNTDHVRTLNLGKSEVCDKFSKSLKRIYLTDES